MFVLILDRASVFVEENISDVCGGFDDITSRDIALGVRLLTEDNLSGIAAEITIMYSPAA